MVGSTLDQMPLPWSFDTYSTSLQERQQTYGDISPASLYSSLEDLGTDFTTDSSTAPSSPLSPALTGSYALPKDSEWAVWEKFEQSPEPAYFKTESFEPSSLSAIPTMTFPLSPAVNPMDLTNTATDTGLFGREVYDTQPLFQPQVPSTTTIPRLPTEQPQLVATRSAAKAALCTSPKSQSTTTQQQASIKRAPRKRKSCSEDDDDQLSQRSSASPPPAVRRASKDSVSTPTMGPKKTAHNMIEKRYRTNLNDKIAALRDSVPALRVMVHRLEPGQDGCEEAEEGALEYGMGQDREDLGGLAPAHKLNKATILGKATEYIMHLERKNQNLAKENSALRSRVEGFEMLVMSRAGPGGMWN